MGHKIPPVLDGAAGLILVGVATALIWGFAAGAVLLGCWLGGWL